MKGRTVSSSRCRVGRCGPAPTHLADGFILVEFRVTSEIRKRGEGRWFGYRVHGRVGYQGRGANTKTLFWRVRRVAWGAPVVGAVFLFVLKG